jgi:hypothetical protein
MTCAMRITPVSRTLPAQNIWARKAVSRLLGVNMNFRERLIHSREEANANSVRRGLELLHEKHSTCQAA